MSENNNVTIDLIYKNSKVRIEDVLLEQYVFLYTFENYKLIHS